MHIDLADTKKKLKVWLLINYVCWAATLLLFIYPAYQWWKFGAVQVNSAFVILSVVNIALVVISTKAHSRAHFLKYQIEYFTKKMEI